jgi:prevent-host-death family protein
MSKTTVTSSELKAHASELLDRVARGKERIVITRHGKPVARLVPYSAKRPALFGFARGSITVHGDLLAPIDVEWEAAR